jgi:hypothetical protein
MNSMWLQQVQALIVGKKVRVRPEEYDRQMAGCQAGVRNARELSVRNRERILDFIKRLPDCSVSDIIAGTGLGRETIRLHMIEMERAGKIMRHSCREWRAC